MKVTNQIINFQYGIIKLELAGAWYLASLLRKELHDTIRSETNGK